MPSRNVPIAVLVVSIAAAAPCAAQTARSMSGKQNPRSSASIRALGLGPVEFPTSGAAAAQPHFLRGVAALHSFEYEEAQEAFRQAQAIEPDFAMAYWGEALAYNRTLWLHEDLEAARAALARLAPTAAARASRAPTAREKAYLAAVEILVGPGDKPTRDRAYAEAMGRLATQYPDDPDAAAFHALALLATTQRGLAGLASGDEHRHALVGSEEQRRAAEILLAVLGANPDHPGANHYLIHAWDDPDHAERALPLARRYAKIAPAAAHALHMPAHIFVQLGLWSEAAASDEASFAASDAWVRRKGLPLAMRSYHSLSWLQYSYLQQGRFRKAAEAVATMEAVALESGDASLKGTAASMRARQVVESRQWSSTKGRTRFDNADELFAIGMGAARTGDALTAGLARQEMARRADSPQTGDRRPLAAIMELQLGALAERNSEAAVRLLESAVAAERQLPPPLGPPALMKSSHELLGEILVELGRPQEARARFEEALAAHPNRSASVLGLARALDAAGERERARERYRAFLDNWAHADAGRPELDEARRTIANSRAGRMIPLLALAMLALGLGAFRLRRRGLRSTAVRAEARTAPRNPRRRRA